MTPPPMRISLGGGSGSAPPARRHLVAYRGPPGAPPAGSVGHLVVRCFGMQGSLDDLDSCVWAGAPVYALTDRPLVPGALAELIAGRRFDDHAIGALMFRFEPARANGSGDAVDHAAAVLNHARAAAAQAVDAVAIRRQAMAIAGSSVMFISVVLAHCDGPWLGGGVVLHVDHPG